MKRKSIEDAVEELKINLETVARVYEWADLMDYENPKIFTRHFLRHFGRRPSEVLKEVRLESIITQLRKNGDSCLQVAQAHSLPDEKALNNYTNRHLDISPNKIKRLSDKELRNLMGNPGSRIGE